MMIIHAFQPFFDMKIWKIAISNTKFLVLKRIEGSNDAHIKNICKEKYVVSIRKEA
jgi:hypothetical protein